MRCMALSMELLFIGHCTRGDVSGEWGVGSGELGVNGEWGMGNKWLRRAAGWQMGLLTDAV